MAIWTENGRHRARAKNHNHRNITKTFRTRQQAELWLAKFKQEEAVLISQNTERNKSCDLDSEYVAAASKQHTVAYALKKAFELDWPDKKQQRERGVRACRMLGFNTPIAEITMDVIDDVVAALRSEQASNGTIIIYLSAIKVVLKRAQRLRLIYELPLFPEGRTLPLPEPNDLVIQEEWYQHFLTCFKLAKYRLLTEFIWETGCRVSEAQKLPWERVNLTTGRIQFVKTKVARARSLPISNKVESILLQCKRKWPNRDPFYKDYDAYLEYYVKRVEMTCKYFSLGPDICKQWRIHTLRHTKLTRLANQGANATQIQYWAGHNSLRTSQGYIHGSGVDLECLINLEGSQQAEKKGIKGQLI